MAVNKEVLQRLAKMINGHRVEACFRAKPVDVGNTSASIEPCIDMKLVAQGLIFAFNSLEFDNNVVPR
jgi:hypothetical protein